MEESREEDVGPPPVPTPRQRPRLWNPEGPQHQHPIVPPPPEEEDSSSHSLSSSTTTTNSVEVLPTSPLLPQITELYTIAGTAIMLAQRMDERNVKEDALKGYDRALQAIDKAVSLASTSTHTNTGCSWPLSPSSPSQQLQGSIGGGGGGAEDQISDLVFKMRHLRKEILERVSDMQSSTTSAAQDYLQGPPPNVAQPGPGYQPHPHPHRDMDMNMDTPPAYSSQPGPQTHLQARIPNATTQSLSYSNLASVLDEIAAEEGAMRNPLPLNARELFNISQNVQIFFISSEDNVSAPCYPTFLRLVLMEQQEGDLGVVTASVPAFLQVGDWTYPLIPNHSPVFRSNEGIYIFPDLTQTAIGSYVGLILPEDVSLEERGQFEETLLQLVGITGFPAVIEGAGQAQEKKEAPPRPPLPFVTTTTTVEKSVTVKDTTTRDEEGEETTTRSISTERRFSTKIAEGLIGGAEAVSRGLVYGATKTSSLIDKGAAFITSRIEPAKEKPNIKPEYKKGMKTAKTVSGKAVQVSGFVVTQVGRATIGLGRYLAPHVHKASTKILAKTVAHDEVDATNKVDQVLEVTTGAVVGFGTVYLGLENAAKTLVKSLANNTVQIVQHKYGEEAGEFATDTAATAGNAALTALNTKNLAPKSVAKKVVKNTGKVIVKQYQEKKGITIDGVNLGQAASLGGKDEAKEGKGQDKDKDKDECEEEEGQVSKDKNSNPKSEQNQNSKSPI